MKKRLNINKILIVTCLSFCVFACKKQNNKDSIQDTSKAVVGYTCPMPEDSVFSDKPGSCPKCGMDLVPMDKKSTLYTCPMPEDSVFTDHPGSCPKCGMDLVPMDKKSILYTCPMPEDSVFTDHPGSCPKCGMDLVPVQRGDPSGLQDTMSLTNASQTQVTVPIEKAVEATISAKGYWAYNPQSLAVLSARFDGRIEKLYVKYNFQKITKGQKIMDIYSPEMVTAQQNYISLLNNPLEANWAEAARQKLLFLGMDKAQINSLEQTRKTSAVVSLYAPYSGHVHQMNQLKDLYTPVEQSTVTDNMENTSTLLTWKEGMYIKKGDKVLSIVDLSNVWAILKIYPQDIGKIHIGQEVTLSPELHPDRSLKAKIGFIEPIQEVGAKFINVRVPIRPSQTAYPIGSLLNASLHYSSSKGLWLPSSAVVYLGAGNTVVFKKTGKEFNALKVTVGEKLMHEVKILQGLNPRDSVALHASYFTDSESFVNIPQ